MQTGLVFNVQHYALHDGPGIRTTVFLKGCPLDCWWCHNPEGRSFDPEILVAASRCMGCGRCKEVCVQRKGNGKGNGNGSAAGLDPSHATQCPLCGACVAICPTGAREIAGTRRSVGEVLEEVLRDRVFYEESGGGVTLSGGEPLAQPAFLKAILAECRRHEIPTAVDTCGFAPREDLMEIAGLSDLVLYDLKLLDDAEHVRYTGASNRLILENLQALGEVHQNIWLRVPIIPGVNDGVEHLEAMARLAASLGGVRQVNLLPYHETAVRKFEQLGEAYRLGRLARPSTESLDCVADRFRAYGLLTKTGG